MNNILSEINIGFDLSNIRKIVNASGNVLGLTNTVHVMPMKKVLDENAYVMDQGGQYVIFVNSDILKKDKINDFNIRMFIHELTHVKQYVSGDLVIDGKDAVWKGKRYDNSVSYENRPWEVEARNNERKYLKEVKQLI